MTVTGSPEVTLEAERPTPVKDQDGGATSSVADIVLFSPERSVTST
ncbi:MAG: hypothetical protein SOI12_04170 [Tractidigestivibacter scatoligenes]